MGCRLRAWMLVPALAAALPALGAWEVIRGDDARRLAIDPASIERRGKAVAFRYLVDFRNIQGDYKTAAYRSLVVKAAIRCAPRTIALGGSEAYTGSEAQGVLVGVAEPTDAEARFQKIEPGTSDEDLWKRVCK